MKELNLDNVPNVWNCEIYNSYMANKFWRSKLIKANDVYEMV